MSQTPYTETETDAAVLADVAARAALGEHRVENIKLPGGRTVLRTLRRGDVIETLIDPERYQHFPDRKTGVVQLLTVPSLAAYVAAHLEQGTAVWVDPLAGRFEAVLDDHEASRTVADGDGDVLPGLPGWGDHRAVCVLQQSRDWRHWTAFNGKLLDQLAFAEHIEAGLHNVIAPPAADLLEVAQTLQGSRNATWKSGARLSDGQVQLRYEEDLQGRAGSGGSEMEIPQTFTLNLAPFEGIEPMAVTASLRWRLNDGRVQLGYRLQRPDVFVRDAIDSQVDLIEAELDLRVLMGTPRPAREIP